MDAVPVMEQLQVVEDGRQFEKKNALFKKNDVGLRTVAFIIELLFTLVCFIEFDNLFDINAYGACALLSCIVTGLSQGIVQTFVKRQYNFDQLLKFYSWGVISGIWTKFWSDTLARFFEMKFARVFFDQILGSPFSIFMFCTFVAFWDYIHLDHYINRNLKRAILNSYCFWPFVSMITFFLMPQEYIVPWNSVANVLWTVYLAANF